MKPNTRYDASEIARETWNFATNAAGGADAVTITAAAVLDAALSLRRIHAMLQSLGADGIHELIRTVVKEQRRAARIRRKKAAAAKAKKLRSVA